MKESFYFSHDYNAQNDSKVEDMRFVLWWEWYWIYWALVERLAQESSHKLPTNYKRIAFAMQADESRIKMVVEDFQLFDIKDWFFFSNRLLSHFAEREEKKRKARENAEARWKKWSEKEEQEAKKDAVASIPQCESDAIKERKGKEKEKKEKKKETENIIFIEEFSEKFQEAFETWIIHRKEKKKPLTDRAMKMQLKDLREWWEADSIASIEKAIKSWWTWLFPNDWYEKKKEEKKKAEEESIRREKEAQQKKRREEEEFFARMESEQKVQIWYSKLSKGERDEIDNLAENHILVKNLSKPLETDSETEKDRKNSLISAMKSKARMIVINQKYSLIQK
jgi:uncharacterized protein YdaU (DUF1376 family)